MRRPIFRRYSTLVSWVFALLPLGAVGAAFIFPYGTALLSGRLGGAGKGAGVILGNPSFLPVAAFTVRQAALSTLTALALGLPGAWLFGVRRSGFSRLIRSLTSIPFAMPPILVVLGFVLFFGNAGWANRLWMIISGGGEGPLRILYKPSAIILAHGFYNFPLVIRLVGDGLMQAKRAYAPAAASLGASGFKTALTVLFPIALPSLLAASLLVFLYSFTSFAVVLVLGGGPAATTLAVEIYRYARISLDYAGAGTLALIETLIAGLALGGCLFFERKSRGITVSAAAGNPPEKRDALPAGTLGIIIYGLVIFFFILGPLLSVPVESFLYRPSRAALPHWSLGWWLSLGNRVLPALGRSLILAFLSATAACFLGILAAGAAKNAGPRSPAGSLLRFCSTAPLVSSGVVLGLGWILLYGRDHSRSLWALVVVHGVSALPFAFASISAGLNSLPENTLRAASAFGAGPVVRILTVELPLSFRRVRSAWGFAAAISLGELNAVLMLGMEEWETLPLLIYRAAGSYRFGLACAAGTLLIAACGGAFLLSEAGSSGAKSPNEEYHGY
jgi:thiamine transport system permease protein